MFFFDELCENSRPFTSSKVLLIFTEVLRYFTGIGRNSMMEYTEEQDINEEATSQEERVVDEKDEKDEKYTETRQTDYWVKVMSRVFKQIFIRVIVVFLFYNVFLILVQGLKGSVQEYVNDGMCPLDEK
jgi:hypothetical protein